MRSSPKPEKQDELKYGQRLMVSNWCSHTRVQHYVAFVRARRTTQATTGCDAKSITTMRTAIVSRARYDVSINSRCCLGTYGTLVGRIDASKNGITMAIIPCALYTRHKHTPRSRVRAPTQMYNRLEESSRRLTQSRARARVNARATATHGDGIDMRPRWGQRVRCRLVGSP